MSWDIFKNNILAYSNNPTSIKDIDTVAKLWATEYDACMKRSGDTINKIPIVKGNTELMEQFFKLALEKGILAKQPYDLVGEMGKGVLAYWQGATLNTSPPPIVPALGSILNIGVTSNSVTNPGIWTPVVPTPVVPEPSTENLLKQIPDDNNTVEGALAVAAETGAEILTDGGDDAGPQLSRIKSQLPADIPKFEKNINPKESKNPPVNNADTKIIECGSGVDYDAKISPNFRLRDVSIGAVFAHKIKAQRGFSQEDIVCNLKNVAVNILEPLKAQFPNTRVNSGFRGTPSIPGGVSQHEKGEAVDIQFTGFTPQQYLEASDWVRANLPFDQFIFEHGNSIWFHISCKRGGNQRNQLLTMYQGKYEPGIKLYYA